MTSNYSTLTEEVDGFLTALHAKVSKIENAVERPSKTDRQKTFDGTNDEIRELIQDHYANLAEFRAIKMEDDRMEELEEANSRRNKLKRQIPIFYLATLVCIIIGFGLYAAFLIAQYHVGSCPEYIFVRRRSREMEKERKYLVKSFTDYPTFADELKSSLDAHLATVNKSMKFPTLEMRQLGWSYDKHAIDAALKHHLELKQYDVDRMTMPRQISHAPAGSLILVGLALSLIINVMTIGAWMITPGSVWQPWQFLKYYRT